MNILSCLLFLHSALRPREYYPRRPFVLNIDNPTLLDLKFGMYLLNLMHYFLPDVRLLLLQDDVSKYKDKN